MFLIPCLRGHYNAFRWMEENVEDPEIARRYNQELHQLMLDLIRYNREIYGFLKFDTGYHVKTSDIVYFMPHGFMLVRASASHHWVY